MKLRLAMAAASAALGLVACNNDPQESVQRDVCRSQDGATQTFVHERAGEWAMTMQRDGRLIYTERLLGSVNHTRSDELIYRSQSACQTGTSPNPGLSELSTTYNMFFGETDQLCVGVNGNIAEVDYAAAGSTLRMSSGTVRENLDGGKAKSTARAFCLGME